MSLETSITFRVSVQQPEKHYLSESSREFSDIELVQNLNAFRGNECSEILQSAQFPSRAFGSENGFVRTVVDCYNEHHNLIIRPDDVWAAIMTQFSFYVNKNADTFANIFVSFEGKKELVVEIPSSLTVRCASHDLFVKLMSKEIDRKLVDQELREWILPNFSTTTDNDLVSIGVLLMATMKKYFDYTCCLACGIPSITLEGTTEDWISIYERLKQVKEYNLEEWYVLLEPILKQFVEAMKGNVNLDFWEKICHHESGGSGPSYVSGWITVFCVFDKDGNWKGPTGPRSRVKPKPILKRKDQVVEDYSIVKLDRWPRITFERIPTGIVEVDVKIKDKGGIHKTIMLAGHLATELMEDGCTLRPTLGWAVASKSDESDDEDPGFMPIASDSDVGKYYC